MKLAYINPTESGEWLRLDAFARKVGKWTYSDYEDEDLFQACRCSS
jgi:hypothetical protein